MLILGIETATEQVSVAHRRPRGRDRPVRGRPRPAPRRDPHAGHRVRAAPRPTSALDELGLVAVDVGPGLFTGMRVGLAAGKALAQALRVPMIGISSLDLLAFPHRQSDRVVVPVIDARKGEVFYAMYRQVPGGVQQVVAPAGRGPSTSSSPTCSPAARRRCASATARCATAREILDGFHCEIADEAHPSAGPLVQLAHARALREEWVSPAEIQPVYLRQPDAQINWATRAARRTRRSVDREHARAVARSRRQPAGRHRADAPPARRPGPGHRARRRTRKPWSANVFHDELDQARDGRRHYLVARRGRTVVGYGGLMFVPRRPSEAHVTNIAVHPRRAARRRGDPAARRARRRGDRPRLRGVDAGGAGQQPRRPGAVPALRLRAGRRPQAATTRTTRTPS